MVQYDHLLDDALRHVQDVRAQEHRAPVVPELQKIIAQLALVYRVQVDERLVQEQQFGLVDEGRGQHHLLPHSLGQVPAERSLGPLEVEEGQPLIDPSVQRSHLVQGPGETEELRGGEIRRRALHLRDYAYPPPDLHGLPGRIEPEHLGPAVRRRDLAGEDLQKSGFTSAVGPEAAEEGPVVHGERRLVQGRELTVSFGQSIHHDRRHAGNHAAGDI
ncbi:hypothetical protein DSECCO2_390470 [anaerobic digester metagenome]